MRIIKYQCLLENHIDDLNFCHGINSALTTSEIIDYLFDKLEEELQKMPHDRINRDGRIGLLIGSSLGELNKNDLPNNTKTFDNHCFTPILRKMRRKYKNIEIVFVFSNTCVSSIDLFYNAQMLLETDVLDYCFILAYDYSGTFIKSGLAAYGILSAEKVLRPFDDGNKGIVLQSAFVIMLVGKDEKKIEERNYAYILSSSIVNDAYSLTSFSPAYNGIKRSIANSLDKLKLEIDEIDIIFCSTNGVFKNDLNYLRALRDLKYQGRVCSVKHLINHTLSATASLEIVVSSELIKGKRLNKFCFNYSLDDNGNIMKTALDYTSDKGKFMVISTGFSGVTGAVIYEIS